MILTDIAGRIKRGEIIVKAPYDLSELKIGANSLDVTLGGNVYQILPNDYDANGNPIVNPLKECKYEKLPIVEQFDENGNLVKGVILEKGKHYLAVSREWISTGDGIVAFLGTRSTLIRFSFDICASGGIGDVGYAGFWTFEPNVTLDLFVPIGARVGQIYFLEAEKTGKVYGGNYANPYTDDPHPVFPKAGNM